MPGADQLIERQIGQKSLDRQPADRDENLRLNDAKLALQPIGALCLLRFRWNSITPTARMRAREATCHRGYVYLLSCCRFIETSAREPTEKGLARPAGKWDAAIRFDFARRLSDQHRARIAGARGDRGDTGSQDASPATQ